MYLFKSEFIPGNSEINLIGFKHLTSNLKKETVHKMNKMIYLNENLIMNI